jgi:hypothetical protein
MPCPGVVIPVAWLPEVDECKDPPPPAPNDDRLPIYDNDAPGMAEGAANDDDDDDDDDADEPRPDKDGCKNAVVWLAEPVILRKPSIQWLKGGMQIVSIASA